MTVVLWTATAFAAVAFVAQVWFIAHLSREHRFRSSIAAMSKPTSTADPQPAPPPPTQADMEAFLLEMDASGYDVKVTASRNGFAASRKRRDENTVSAA